MKRFGFEILEDNAGGIHLFAKRGSEAVYGCLNCEYGESGIVLEAIGELLAGADPTEWGDGCTDPGAVFHEYVDHDPATAQTVADQTGLYPAHMGTEARLQLGIADEDYREFISWETWKKEMGRK